MSLASFIGEIPSTVFAMAAKGALISCAALGVAAALRRASAARRHLVLALAALALLVLPLMTVFLPAWDLQAPRVEPVALRVFSPGLPADRASMPGLGAAPGQPGFKPHTWGAAPGPANSSPGFLSLLALAVSLLLLVRLFAAVVRLARLRTGSRPAPAEWQEQLDQHRRRLGIARSVRLAVSSAVTVPVTFGWRRPMVLIPEAALGWDEQPLREALVHELSHVRRGDWPVQVIARAACALHWLDPLVWLLCRRLLLEAELACDDQVLRAGAGAEGYAERLVALARQASESSHHPASAVAFARPSGLASRVAAILDSGRRRGGPGRPAIAGAAAAALLLLLLLAPARLVRAAPEMQQAVRQGVEEGAPGALDGADPIMDGVLDGVREALAEPASIREGIEGTAPLTGEALEEAVEQGVSGALDDEAIRDGAREGVNEDSIRDGAREGIDEGKREALPDAVQSGVNPNTVVLGDGTPLTGASREYARILRRLLTGELFEPVAPGEGC